MIRAIAGEVKTGCSGPPLRNQMRFVCAYWHDRLTLAPFVSPSEQADCPGPPR
jgi:lysophospholipid acyltransferase (LPLAT)-like uncharacterized protein